MVLEMLFDEILMYWNYFAIDQKHTHQLVSCNGHIVGNINTNENLNHSISCITIDAMTYWN